MGRGETSNAANPVLDLYTHVGNPAVLTDVSTLAFRIFDITTAAKKVTPVQIYPLPAGTFFALDPTQADPLGHRISTGHYFAPYTVDAAEPLGDHKIEWQFQQNPLSPIEVFSEEFTVTPAVFASGTPAPYCTIQEVRDEGFADPPFTDARINFLIALASRYIDRVTGRWFSPRTFDDTNRFIVDGKGSRTLHLEIPIIRLDRLYIEDQALLSSGLTEVSLDAVRAYNRHISGMTLPDDRENPKLSFIQQHIISVTQDGLWPPPRVFPAGRMNIHLEGVFGYTEPDGTTFGNTPLLIRQVACRLVARDLLLDSDACEKLNTKVKFRISSDKEGGTTIKLQDLWLKGAFTGDSEIDNVLMMYKRPINIAAV